MSLSKPIPLCRFCESEKGKYMCPRCNIRYCSAKCYKDLAHERCTEMFFQEWVMTTLREQSAEESEKRKMIEMLKRAEEDGALDEEESVSANAEDLPIEDRFQDLNLEGDVDEKQIWDRLSEKEKDQFKSILKDESKLGEIIPIKKPWWSITQLNLVSENDTIDINSDNIAKRPSFPIDIKSLSTITSQPPVPTLPFNILNVIYAYVFLVKFNNFDLREFIEEVLDSLLYLSPVLSEQKNYLSLEESIQDSIRLLAGPPFLDSEIVHAKSLLYDVCSIIDGPSNAQAHTYVLCALNDVKMLVAEYKRISRAEKSPTAKDMRQTLQQVLRKIDFYLSWTVQYHESDLKPIAAKIRLQYAPEIVESFHEANSCPEMTSELKLDAKKVLIEELN